MDHAVVANKAIGKVILESASRHQKKNSRLFETYPPNQSLNPRLDVFSHSPTMHGKHPLTPYTEMAHRILENPPPQQVFFV